MAIGRLARNKGYDLLIQGFSVLARANPGSPPLPGRRRNHSDALEDTLLAELKELVVVAGPQDRVQFGNFIPDDQLADYYRAADLFVLSSRYEPFGMTAIEAMACGPPPW
jgi:mannosylfructose-phosphate synthase